MYRNITRLWRWGGLDKVTRPGQVYLDEPVRGEVERNRLAIFNLAIALGNEALEAQHAGDTASAKLKAGRMLTLLQLQKDRLPEAAMTYTFGEYYKIAEIHRLLYKITDDRRNLDNSLATMETALKHYSPYIRYYQSLPAYLAGTISGRDRRIITLFVRTIDRYRDYSGDEEAARALQRRLETEFAINIDKLRLKH